MSSELPAWLRSVQDRLQTMRGEDLSGFVPPDDAKPREGAVLVLFGEGPEGPDLLLTERGHTLRSQPAQVAFPGGALDPGETAVEAALREAQEETGLDPAGVDVIAVLPRIWLPPRNFAVTTVVGYWREPSGVHVVDPVEVHAIFREPLSKLLEPSNRFMVRHPLGWAGPGWMVGPEQDVLLWGFTAGVVDAIFEHVGWTRQWDKDEVRNLPPRHIDWPRIADILGVQVDDYDNFDPVAAGLVQGDYFDYERDHKRAGRSERAEGGE